MYPSLLFIAPQKSVALDDCGRPVQKARTNVSLPAMTIIGALEREGMECHFLDQSAEGANQSWERSDHLTIYGLPIEAVLDRIAELKSKCALITSMFTFEQMLVDELVVAIRRSFPSIKIILGGIHASARPEWHFEASSPDVIVLGEGEETVVELIRELEKGSPALSSVRGIMYHDGQGKLVRTQPRPLIADLNRPWSLSTVLRTKSGGVRYWDTLTAKSPVYRALGLGEDTPSFSLYGSRGCPFGCSYCATTPRDGTRVRHMGAERMFEDFKIARRVYRAGAIYNQADTFGLAPEDRQFLEKVAEYRENGDTDFVINNPNAFFVRIFFPPRLSYKMDVELVRLFARAGVNTVTLAIETLTHRFNKKIPFEKVSFADIQDLCMEFHRRGMRVDAYFMYGFPGETREEFDRDIKAGEALCASGTAVTFAFLTLLPQTSYYREALARGMRESDYRKAVLEGYSWFRPVDRFNLSGVPTEHLISCVKQFGQPWV